MIELSYITPRTNLGYKGSMLGKVYNYDYTELLMLDKEHLLYISYDTGNLCTYAVTNKKSKVTLVLSTVMKGNYDVINVVEAKKNNSFPAVKLYEFLIKKLGLTLVTNQQSEGGKRIWQNLCKVKGINVYGWDFKTNVPINTDVRLKDTDDLYVSKQEQRYHSDTARINLVATGV
jgi:hypothetical protein